MRTIFISIFFLVQVVGIIYSRFLEEKYFCWAPFDQISVYEIKAEINGVELSAEEIRNRYNLQRVGRENRSIHNVFSILRQYEESYGNQDIAEVKVTYWTNGKEQEEWTFSTE